MAPDARRILLLTPYFWPEVRRGTERLVLELARGLSAGGDRPVVVCSARRPGRGREEDAPVWRLPRLPAGRALWPEGTLHAPFLGAVAAGAPADLLHAFHVGDAAVAARSGRRPLVFTHMGIPDGRDLSAVRGRRRRTLQVLARARAVVVLSRAAADALLEATGHSAHVIPPAIDLDRFVVGSQRTEEPTVLCSAAADEPRKRVALLLEAWPLVRRARPRAQLLLARQWAGAVVDPAAPPAGVQLVATERTEELARLNGSAWVAALPSVDEAFGIVLAEALATGTPVVATRAGGMPEIVDRPEVGRLFDGGAPELARALLEAFELAEDPGTRSACRGRAQEFGRDRVVAAHRALYAEVLAGPRR